MTKGPPAIRTAGCVEELCWNPGLLPLRAQLFLLHSNLIAVLQWFCSELLQSQCKGIMFGGINMLKSRGSRFSNSPFTSELYRCTQEVLLAPHCCPVGMGDEMIPMPGVHLATGGLQPPRCWFVLELTGACNGLLQRLSVKLMCFCAFSHTIESVLESPTERKKIDEVIIFPSAWRSFPNCV